MPALAGDEDGEGLRGAVVEGEALDADERLAPADRRSIAACTSCCTGGTTTGSPVTSMRSAGSGTNVSSGITDSTASTARAADTPYMMIGWPVTV